MSLVQPLPPGPLDIVGDIHGEAEALEQGFYAGRAGEEWLDALAPLGTDADKPFLETAPWLIAVFYERYGVDAEREPADDREAGGGDGRKCLTNASGRPRLSTGTVRALAARYSFTALPAPAIN